MLLTLLFSVMAIDQALASSPDTIEENATVFSTKNKLLRPEIVKLALKAYVEAQKQGVKLTKPIITVIDYSLASSVKRLWVLDLKHNKILFNSLVAHGKYSGEYQYATQFSDKIGSLQSSIGVFVTGKTYEGQHGYSLKIKGLEQGFNANAEVRTIVIHGAWYVTEGIAKIKNSIGKSWGCPALEPHITTPIINTIKDGSLIFSYYPNQTWLQTSKFINGVNNNDNYKV